MVLITLLSDFGLDDPYLAQMKGVIMSVAPGAEIVDISHGIEKHNIAIGSYILETTVPFFPHDSIHVAVVDPGVGGARMPIAIVCDRGVLVGPDNGLMA
ncbi:SAM-dependent chlorinase/fluorinase, partial [Candidatus Bathyarchaeota archaeon]|nr:SAM-dependent chlorinase/fluorinase [Candidatus Bathyarchaeota archaeon]